MTANPARAPRWVPALMGGIGSALAARLLMDRSRRQKPMRLVHRSSLRLALGSLRKEEVNGRFEQQRVMGRYVEAWERNDSKAATAISADDVIYDIPGRSPLAGDVAGKWAFLDHTTDRSSPNSAARSG
jgi:hypothetical protein